MIIAGRYSVWFETPIGKGAGLVELHHNGMLSGGDTTFAYAGQWKEDGQRFEATLSAKRIAPGPPGVFGKDAVDIILVGQSDGDGSVSCAGFAKQAPGLKLEVALIRMTGSE